jgi:hypothetical protein
MPAAAAVQQQHGVIDIASDSEDGPEAAAGADAAEIVGLDVVADGGPVVLEAASQEAQPGYATASSGSMEESSEECEETSPAVAQQQDGAAAAAAVVEEEEAEMLSSSDSEDVSSSVDGGFADVEMEEGAAGADMDAAAAAGAAVTVAGAAAAASDNAAAQDIEMSSDSEVQQQQQVDAAMADHAAAAASDSPQQQQQRISTGLTHSSSPHSAAWLGNGIPAVHICGPPSGLTESVPDDASVPEHLLLRMPLRGVHSGNVTMLKLLSSEDKMHEYDDPAEEPNIDIQCVLLRGVAVQLQEELQDAAKLL